ncbi:MAG: hypothetical protein H7195_09260 [Chryseobacterium sp.]|nr:hypothetical protein [Chryseobacterium sp.]
MEKNSFKKYSDLYIINSLTTVLGIIFYLVDKKPEIPIAIFATGISISFGFRQYKIENDKMFKELFLMFNEKYDRKFNDRLNKIDEKTIENSEYELSWKESQLVIDYLNLCAEKYLWYTKDRIDEVAWLSWEKGMKYYLEINPIKKCVQKQKNQKDSYYGLFEKLNLNLNH